jgi:hypothetical protein
MGLILGLVYYQQVHTERERERERGGRERDTHTDTERESGRGRETRGAKEASSRLRVGVELGQIWITSDPRPGTGPPIAGVRPTL